MIFDEFYFHRQRGLGRWESLGHPVDTSLFLACFLYCLFLPHGEGNIAGFTALSALSSVVIAKDEWVHHRECRLAEQWVHSLLFIVHPFALWGLYQLWKENKAFPVLFQALLIFVFLVYQILYWNLKRTGNENREHQ